MRPRHFLYLAGGPSDRPAMLDRPEVKGRILPGSIYDLVDIDLTGCIALLVPIHADQRQFARCRPTLEAYLTAGGAIVFNGHLAPPFLRTEERPVGDARD